jgi:hypothetical protein
VVAEAIHSVPFAAVVNCRASRMGHPIVGELSAGADGWLADDVEGAGPAGLVEDVDEDVAHEGDAVGDGGLVDLV